MVLENFHALAALEVDILAMTGEVGKIAYIVIASIAMVVEGRVGEVLAEGIGRYEKPAAPIAPLTAVNTRIRGMLESGVSTSKGSVAGIAGIFIVIFIKDELVSAGHDCCCQM